jgi:hypothetical protein
VSSPPENMKGEREDPDGLRGLVVVELDPSEPV